MQAETLDVLEKAEIPAPQARAIARAIDIEIAASRQGVASRADVLIECEKLRTCMSELKASLEARMGALETKLVSMVGTVEAKIEAAKSDVLGRMYGALLAQLAVLLGIAYFFAKRLG